MMDHLKAEVQRIGKPQWRPMLAYVAALHEKSTHPPRPPFPHPWEEIGPGYCYGPAFGHWDIVHAVLDTSPQNPNTRARSSSTTWPHSKRMAWCRASSGCATRSHVGAPTRGTRRSGRSPCRNTPISRAPTNCCRQCYEPLIRQIGWFERYRRAERVGFFYTDILDRTWESGVDEGVRFDQAQPGPFACIDATSHVYALYQTAAEWAEVLGHDPTALPTAGRTTAQLPSKTSCTTPRAASFTTSGPSKTPPRDTSAFEGMWPVVVGAATAEQAQRVIDEHLLNPDRFFTAHPICTVAHRDPGFELRMWRGPTWNSMTYWAARGCLRYGRAGRSPACSSNARWMPRPHSLSARARSGSSTTPTAAIRSR